MPSPSLPKCPVAPKVTFSLVRLGRTQITSLFERRAMLFLLLRSRRGCPRCLTSIPLRGLGKPGLDVRRGLLLGALVRRPHLVPALDGVQNALRVGGDTRRGVGPGEGEEGAAVGRDGCLD